MSNKKLKSGGSYDRIQLNLMESNGGKELTARVFRRLHNWRLGEAKFSTGYRDDPQCHLYVEYGEGDEMTKQTVGIDAKGVFYFDVADQMIITDDDINYLVKENFGVVPPGAKKPVVPTYNCSKARVIEHLLHARLTDRLISLELHMVSQRIAVRAEITKSIQEYTMSDTFKNGCQGAREDIIVKKIRDVLGQFKDATPSVLKRALDEYVMHEIMEG